LTIKAIEKAEARNGKIKCFLPLILLEHLISISGISVDKLLTIIGRYRTSSAVIYAMAGGLNM
jgi:hypothetical protein